ncbi:MAG: hypothetical protein ACOYKM_08315 [Caulobacterales bacterium]|jgi:hypothetical protein
MLTRQAQHRFELQARRKQRSLPPGEALFSDLYATASDYGASMLRPFIALGLVIFLFGVIYAVMHNPFGVIPTLSQVESAMTFSASRVFPFGTYEDVSKDWITAFENTSGGLATFGLRVLATVQSVFAILLSFLFGLAVRRRFQIS